MSDKDALIKELRELLNKSRKDIHDLERQNDLLTCSLVSAFVTLISCVVFHLKGWF